MKKILIFLIPVLLFSCHTAKQVSDTSTSNNQSTDSRIEYVYQVVSRDSVVFRDSVIMRPDGSVDRSHSEKISKTLLQKIYYRTRITINNQLTITKTQIATTIKTVYKRGFLWWSGLLFWVSLFIIVLIKLNKKFSLWEKLTKAL